MRAIEPIFLLPYLKETVWGGDTLQTKYAKHGDSCANIGESWEVSALNGCESIVANGRFCNQTLDRLYDENRSLFGTDSDCFPFLVKLIDAKSWLSIQVHEQDNPFRIGKNEAWIVLEAKPNAKLILGDDFNHQAELRTALETGTLMEHLCYHDVKSGDVFFVPSGTIHSIGSGLVIYEIQQPSDITYRLYDMSGQRELHIEQACEVYRPHANYGKITPKELPSGNHLLISCEHFAVELVMAENGNNQHVGDRFACFTALGDGKIMAYGREWGYCTGGTFVIPAGFGQFTFKGGQLLKAYVPINKNK